MSALLVLVVLLLGVYVALEIGRRRRDAALEPVRLGPSWSPFGDFARDEVRSPADAAARADDVAARTGIERSTVTQVLRVWDEYLGVLGLAPLPEGQARLVYDPSDPPGAHRGVDGRPVPDRSRAARDAARRIGVAETVAYEILEADASHAHLRPEVIREDEDAWRS
jgi:hypothetical protein